MCEDDKTIIDNLVDNLAFYQIIEDKLKKECNFQGPVTSVNELSHRPAEMESKKVNFQKHNAEKNLGRNEKIHSSLEKSTLSENNVKFNVDESVLYLNRYCAKLPSDTL